MEGICKKCGEERPLMKNGMCGSCMRSITTPSGEAAQSRAGDDVPEKNILVKKIDKLIARVDDVAEDVTAVKDLVSSEDTELPGEVLSSVDIDEDDEDEDDEIHTGGSLSSAVALILVVFVVLVVVVLAFPGIVARFVSGAASKTRT